jgi:hypothetical protein
MTPAAAAGVVTLLPGCSQPFFTIGQPWSTPPLTTHTRTHCHQVPIFSILGKFDGATITDDIRLGRRKFRLTRLPRFLCLHMRRFTKNNFYIEKNPTLVTFPVKNFDLREAVPVPTGEAQGVLCVGGGVAGEGERLRHVLARRGQEMGQVLHLDRSFFRHIQMDVTCLGCALV